MKKTLLAAAAILAVGCLASQAQVYSQNIVGYYNISVPNNQFSLISGQLLNADGSNNVANVLGSGLASQTATVLFWNGSGFNTYTYYNQADAESIAGLPAGFYDGDGNSPTNLFAPGVGAFVFNGAATTLTIVGTVPQGTFTNYVTPGFNMYSINAPINTNIDSSLVNFPATSTQDTLLIWNGAGYTTYTYYDQADAESIAGVPAGWYDADGNDYSTTPSLWQGVGQGFFVYHVGSTFTWTNSLSF